MLAFLRYVISEGGGQEEKSSASIVLASGIISPTEFLLIRPVTIRTLVLLLRPAC